MAGRFARTEPAEPAPDPAGTIPWTAYVCEDGRVLQALYPDRDTAQLKLAGETLLLKIAVSGSGARSVGSSSSRAF